MHCVTTADYSQTVGITCRTCRYSYEYQYRIESPRHAYDTRTVLVLVQEPQKIKPICRGGTTRPAANKATAHFPQFTTLSHCPLYALLCIPALFWGLQ